MIEIIIIILKKTMFENLETIIGSNPKLSVIISALTWIVIVLIVNILISFVFKKMGNRLKERHYLLGAFYISVITPLQSYVTLIGICAVPSVINLWFHIIPMSVVHKILKVGVILAIAWTFLRFKKYIKSQAIKRSTREDDGYNDFSKIETTNKLFDIITFIISLVTIMSIFSIPLTGLLTLSGIGAAALTYANQQLISNIFSGIILYFDRPFSIGDWIYTIDGTIEGTVEHIGLRLTRLRSFDKREIFMPNSDFNTKSIVNASRMTNRRILQYVGVRYCDVNVLSKILESIREMLKKHPDIDQTKITLVNLVNGKTKMGSNVEGAFGASSINFQVYTFTKTTNWAKFQNIQDDVMLKISTIIESYNAEVAFPSSSIYFGNSLVDVDKS